MELDVEEHVPSSKHRLTPCPKPRASTLYVCRCMNKRAHAKTLGDEKGSGLVATDPNNNSVPINLVRYTGGFELNISSTEFIIDT